MPASLNLGFESPGSGRVNVEVDTEPRHPDGSIMIRAGEPFESFDYDYSIGDDSTTITFDCLQTLTACDQDIEAWVARRDQAPAFLSTTEQKARFKEPNLLNPAAGDVDGYMPASYVLTPYPPWHRMGRSSRSLSLRSCSTSSRFLTSHEQLHHPYRSR